MAELGADDLRAWLDLGGGEEFADLLQRFEAAHLSYRELDFDRHNAAVLQVLLELDRDQFARSGPQRQNVWEMAWEERLEAFARSGDLSQLTPVYFSANSLIRLRGRFIQPARASFQQEFSALYREGLFRKYFQAVEHVFEFGAGSGYNLIQLHQLFPHLSLHGLDWSEAAVQLIENLGRAGRPLSGRRFDFFAPDPSLELPPGSTVLTMCALEQIGSSFEPFLAFLMSRRPALVVHMEPLLELYRGDDLLDYLGQRYHLQRNYLQGYLPEIQQLAKQGRVEILHIQKVPFGNHYHDGYSTLVWRPIESH